MTLTNKQSSYLGAALVVAVAAGLLVVTLPALAALSIVGRLLFPVALVAAAVVILASPTLRRRLLLAEAEPVGLHKGLRLPQGVTMHPTHSWARRDTRREVTVGADDMMEKVLGPVDEVLLPEVGTRVEAGQPVSRLRRGNRTVALRAPVSGTVIQVNTRLTDEPTLVNEAPYGAGWVVRVEPSGKPAAHLHKGREARAWFRSEVDRLVATVSQLTLPTAAMQDGGPMVDDLHARIDDVTWRRVKATFFDEAE